MRYKIFQVFLEITLKFFQVLPIHTYELKPLLFFVKCSFERRK